MTPAEWVREALDVARRGESTAEVHRKLATIRAAAKHEFPFDDIAS